MIIKSNGHVWPVKNLVIFDEEDSILRENGEPYKVFTPFKKAWLAMLQKQVHELEFDYNPRELFKPDTEIDRYFSNFEHVESIQSLFTNFEESTILKGGETEAQYVWQNFCNSKIYNYDKNRNYLDLEGTSKLSPHLKFGTISPFQIVSFILKDLKRNQGSDTFLSEIIWREFYKYINIYFPHVEDSNFNPQFDNLAWEFDQNLFSKWCRGKTGYPIVDACMRCLNETGWMHNRGRMIVGSFLCKDMHMHWRHGEKYFQQNLIDWDKTANNGGWQWVAGSGTDASPYFRIFNPVLQGKKIRP